MFLSERCSICGEGYNLSEGKPDYPGRDESEVTPAISCYSARQTGDVKKQLPHGHITRSRFSSPRSFNSRKRPWWSSASSPILASSTSYLQLTITVFVVLCLQLHSQGTVEGLSLPEHKSLPMHRISSTQGVGRSKDPVSLYTEQDSTNNSTYKQPSHKISNDLYMDPCKAAGFINDIALTEDDVNDLMKMWHNNIEVQVDDPNAKHLEKISEPASKHKARKKNKRSHRKRKKCRKKDLKCMKKKMKNKVKKSPPKPKSVSEASRSWRTRTRTRRAATARQDRLWQYGVIPYQIEANFSGSHKALFRSAMRHWENHTCITFVERTPEHVDYIVFTERPCGDFNFAASNLLNGHYDLRQDSLFTPALERGLCGHHHKLFHRRFRLNQRKAGFSIRIPGPWNILPREVISAPTTQQFNVFHRCCSYVGKRGNGAQAISIGKNCDKFGIVVHELGHVIGFWHEHTRPDRDDHVQIMYKNIMPGQEYNFNKLTPADVNSLGEEYDYGSIMHYARSTFARVSFVDTILPKRKYGTRDIGQRIKLSPGDIRQANKLYQCPTCGRTLQAAAGEFSHEPNRQGTAEREVCEWRISATHGEKIVLNITSMDIPESRNCMTDYLEVRDGYYERSAKLGQFCGKTMPGVLQSTDSRMWLRFMSSQKKGEGFVAKYEAICGGVINKDRGILTSPNSPDDYRANQECVWRLTVQKGYLVGLMFQSFEIENHDNCVYDYLEIRDGADETSPSLGKFCGYKVPEDIRSSGNQLYVKFVSDGSVQKAGFSATFTKEYDECLTEYHGCDHTCVNTLGSYKCICEIGYELHSDGKKCEDACGGYISIENGTFQSPSFPDLYPTNKYCVWQIVAPKQHRITLNFSYFDLEGNNQDCEYDSVRVSNGLNSDTKAIGIFCGSTLPTPITSSENSLRIEFSSDNSVQKTGFNASFFTDKDECALKNGGCQQICKNTIGSYQCACQNGFTLHENKHDCKEGGCKHQIKTPSGNINSPKWPDFYPSRKDCVWTFTVTDGHRVKLEFEEFELEPHQECTYDHIEVFDGTTTNSRSLGRFCGNKIPPPIYSSGNTMFMIFYSDASVQRKGFSAMHSTVCGGHLLAKTEPKFIFSHAKYGDQNYDNAADCDWIIQAEDEQQIYVEFKAFEIEDETECMYDYVKLYDGKSDTGQAIGKYCGSNKPPPVTSTGHILTIRFVTDDTVNWKGFSLIYRLAEEDHTTGGGGETQELPEVQG